MIRRVTFATDSLGLLGGIQTVLDLLAAEFVERGLDVRYYSALAPRGDAVVPGDIFVGADGIERTTHNPLAQSNPGPLGLGLLAKRVWTPVWDVRMRRRVREYLQRLTAEDAVIIMGTRSHAQIWRSGFQRARSEATFIGQFHSSEKALHDLLVRWDPEYPKLARQDDVFLVLSEFDVAGFERVLGREVIAMPNPCAMPLATSHAPSRRTVVFSRYSEEKRVPEFVSAFAKASLSHGGWSLDVFGEGPDLPRIEAAAAAAGPAVTIHGGTRDVKENLDGAALLGLGSLYEGLPLVLLEAAARGVSSVCTPASPAVMDIAKRSGYLAEGFEVDDIAEALGQAMTDIEQGVNRFDDCLEVASQFSPETVISKWLGLLQELESR